MTPATLPPGVVVHPLTAHTDARGTLTEIYRDSWDLGCRPVQVNAVWSEAGVLRGVHVPARHADHLCVVTGWMLLGLHDATV
jgi:dTDP-4-dehydrorhamnose 3,5-epimerase